MSTNSRSNASIIWFFKNSTLKQCDVLPYVDVDPTCMELDLSHAKRDKQHDTEWVIHGSCYRALVVICIARRELYNHRRPLRSVGRSAHETFARSPRSLLRSFVSALFRSFRFFLSLHYWLLRKKNK